jgi:hypothetical protein
MWFLHTYIHPHNLLHPLSTFILSMWSSNTKTSMKLQRKSSQQHVNIWYKTHLWNCRGKSPQQNFWTYNDNVTSDRNKQTFTLNQTASGPQIAPDLLNASGSTNPAAPSMAHRPWISSYAWYLQHPSPKHNVSNQHLQSTYSNKKTRK